MDLRNPVPWLLFLGIVVLLAQPSAVEAQGTLFVEGDSVGIGTDTPTEFLHIQSTVPGNTLSFIQNTSGPVIVGSRYQSSVTTWDFRMDGVGDFIFDNAATGGEDFKIRKDGQVRVGPAPAKIVLQPNGNIDIQGTLNEGSSRLYKEGLETMDPREVLAKVARLPVMEWSYMDRSSRHIGPMAEDFHDLFGLGDDPKALSPRDVAGVALLALQGLHQTVGERDAEIEQLKSAVAELRALVEALTAQ